MKLSIFPYVVQKEILDNVTNSSLFLLSFVSEDMKRLIQSSQTTRFQSISQIVYANARWPRIDQRAVYIESDTIMEFTDCREESKNDYFQLNVSGKIMDFRFSKEYQYLEAYFHPSEKESVIASIHKYFLEFFGDAVEYQYVEHYKEFVPHIHKLSLCLYFWPDDEKGTTNIENIEEYLALSPVLKHINMHLDKPELFCPKSKFWQAESIDLTPCINTIPAFLRHFQGRQAFLRCDERNILGLREFMNRWKFGIECQMLEYLKIEFNNPPNELLNANGVKHIDATKTPPTHTLPKLFDTGSGLTTDPIISHSYVVRKTDNRVASVSIQNESFSFGVWQETEEEFLRMVT